MASYTEAGASDPESGEDINSAMQSPTRQIPHTVKAVLVLVLGLMAFTGLIDLTFGKGSSNSSSSVSLDKKIGLAEQDAAEPSSPSGPCLCAFDVDRTLTGYQGILGPKCPGNKVMPGVKDYAYLYATPPGYGNLTLSRLAQHLNTTFCNRCFIGLATAGGASLDGEKAVLLDVIKKAVWLRAAKILPKTWLTPENDAQDQDEAPPPLMSWCPDKKKHLCTQRIVDWYAERDITFDKSDVYFFDDKAENVLAFEGSGFNAKQVSCASRDGDKGYCGGQPDEVKMMKGVHACQQTTAAAQ
eukprot:TRINITY_DN38184_c0_g1_i1.p1 TRINITY_DN38184_c0_g1~~TRINITY_DN38184_c0_g1_i1.p1  ORF type:complete len:299 (-),score=58.17 TRINITY_DN38184_c0_g1_i1:168-1064(-)